MKNPSCVDHVPIKTSICTRCPIAVFDCQRLDLHQTLRPPVFKAVWERPNCWLPKMGGQGPISICIVVWKKISRPASVSDCKVLFFCSCSCSYSYYYYSYYSYSYYYYYYSSSCCCCCYYYYYYHHHYHHHHHHHSYSYSCAYSDAYSNAYSDAYSTPLLLYSFLPSSPSTTLVVPVANDTAYNTTVLYRYSSQDAHDTDRPVLIWYAFHWLFKHALATQAVSDLRLCLRLFFSQAST